MGTNPIAGGGHVLYIISPVMKYFISLTPSIFLNINQAFSFFTDSTNVEVNLRSLNICTKSVSELSEDVPKNPSNSIYQESAEVSTVLREE
jgi:hypothetical protein